MLLCEILIPAQLDVLKCTSYSQVKLFFTPRQVKLLLYKLLLYLQNCLRALWGLLHSPPPNINQPSYQNAATGYESVYITFMEGKERAIPLCWTAGASLPILLYRLMICGSFFRGQVQWGATRHQSFYCISVQLILTVQTWYGFLIVQDAFVSCHS